MQVFRGLNNVTDALRLGLDWLVQADNVDITDTGAVEVRGGYDRALAGSITGAFSTADFSRMYFVDGGDLKAMTGPTSATTLASDLSEAPMHFAEINDQVYFNNGVDSGIILLDNSVIPWAWPVPDPVSLAATTGDLPAGQYQVCCTFMLPDGRRTGAGQAVSLLLGAGEALQISDIPQLAGLTTDVFVAPADSSVFQYAGTAAGGALVWNGSPDDLGADLETALMLPLPAGADLIQAWRARLYAASYLQQTGQTAVWRSQALGFHLFDLASDFIMVPGQVLMLAPHADGLIIGTDKAIHLYDGQRMTLLAAYGVVPGWHWSKDDDDGRVLFWSKRGVCAALPFSNLTERQVSVAPGASAGGTIVRSQGRKRYLVALQQGGSAFNPHS